jgi:prepilin-type processing-associated H-X9-DG protein
MIQFALRTLGLAFLLVTLSGCALLPGSSRAIETKTMNTLKQVGIACQVYRIDHGALPTKTDQLRSYLIGAEELLADVKIDPNAGNAKPNTAAITVLARSTKELPSGRTALVYVDGHVELK